MIAEPGEIAGRSRRRPHRVRWHAVRVLVRLPGQQLRRDVVAAGLLRRAGPVDGNLIS